MAFKPINFDNGLTKKIALAISQTVLKGDTLVWASGYLAVGAANDETSDYVALEAITTGAAEHTEILCVPALHSGVSFEADTSAETAVAQKGVTYELSDKNTLDNEATAAATGFTVDEIVGVAADKKVIGRWVR